jgi:hypothetical protein
VGIRGDNNPLGHWIQQFSFRDRRLEFHYFWKRFSRLWHKQCYIPADGTTAFRDTLELDRIWIER